MKHDDTDLPLFYHALKIRGESKDRNAFARGTDPITSHEAAESVRGKEATRMESRVLGMLKMHPNGLTSHEVVIFTGISWQSLTPRIRPLVRKGLIEDSGVRRLGTAGRNVIVWRAK